MIIQSKDHKARVGGVGWRLISRLNYPLTTKQGKQSKGTIARWDLMKYHGNIGLFVVNISKLLITADDTEPVEHLINVLKQLACNDALLSLWTREHQLQHTYYSDITRAITGNMTICLAKTPKLRITTPLWYWPVTQPASNAEAFTYMSWFYRVYGKTLACKFSSMYSAHHTWFCSICL